MFILLILGVGFFSSAETAYLSLSNVKIRNMVEQGKKGAKLAASLKQKMDSLLTTVLIGTNLLNSLTSALATALAISVFGKSSVEIVPFIVTFVITTFGQIIPKTAAALNPELFATICAVPLRVIETVMFPVVWIFEKLSHDIVKIAEILFKPNKAIITEEELKTLIDLGENEGTIEKDESYMLNKLIRFNDLSVNDIMKHRSKVSMINADYSQDQVIDEFLKTGFSTLTVYKDNIENVVGILNYKTVLFGSAQTDLGPGYAQRMMSNVIFVPGTFSVLEVLNKFRQSERKFAVVLNEQGQTSGIITMKEILQVVFGRMTDENDAKQIPPEDKIQLVSLNTFLVPGDIKLEEVNSILGLSLESESMNTLGGWLLEKIGYLPSPGTVCIHEHSVFTAEEVQHRRISLVRIKV